jgi:hypothetical protein
MSSQIQQEIIQKTAELARLQRANDVSKRQAEGSMMSGDYGHANYTTQIFADDPEIKRLQNYINSLNGVMNMWGDDQQKLQAFNQIKVGYNSQNPRGYGYGYGGRRRYKKKSVKRGGRKRKTRRNTRRRR